MAASIVVSSVIPAPIAQVWAIWREPDRIPEWIPAVKSVLRIGDQDGGVGAELEFTARSGFRNLTYRTRISEWEEAKHVRSDIVPGSGSGAWTGLLERQSTDWYFAAEGERTRITARQEMKLKGPADLLSGPWLLVFDRPLYQRAFRKLASLATQGPGEKTSQ
jgi:carbon monoxide dehydrogenase subunit G